LLGVSLALCRVRLAPRLWLLVLLAGLLASPALATISMSRMRFASTLLLLPVVCEGLAALRRPGSSIPGPLRKACAACLLLASLTLCFVFLRPAFKHFVVPSGHYGALISACSHIGLMPPDTVNTLLFRRGPSGPQTIGLDMASAPSVSVVGQPNNRKVLIELPQPNQFRSVIVHAKAGEPLLLKWFVPGRDLAATTEFAPGAFSCEWRPTGLPDVSVKTGINYKKDIWSGQ